ncbi:MAG TPA: SRPBCC family protein [Gemmataceae bacterium]|nr:SRPBCC family protein [Gemmataceae bacterium]
MMIYTLQREQHLPHPIEQVFAFFADAGNLEAITPPWLRFQILTPRPIGMVPGVLIKYRLRWHGMPIHWVTRIDRWEPPTRFCDVQLQGPYRLWEHEHAFEPCDSGTRMRDVVRYAIPYGVLGRFAHRVIVRSDLEAIFDYRAVRVEQMLEGAR